MHQSQSQAARYGQGAAQQAAYTRGKRGRIRAARAAQPALDRRTGLCRLLPLWPRELDDQSLQGRRHIVERLRKALRAERRRGIRRQGDFLWPAVERPVPVRRRSGDPPARLALICEEEITAAMHLVLASQHATLPADLITSTARLLGLRLVNQAIAGSLQALIDRHLASGTLQRLANGMLYREMT